MLCSDFSSDLCFLTYKFLEWIWRHDCVHTMWLSELETFAMFWGLNNYWRASRKLTRGPCLTDIIPHSVETTTKKPSWNIPYSNLLRCFLFVFVFNISRVKELRRSICKCRQTINGRRMSLRKKATRIVMDRIRMVILIFPSLTLIVILVWFWVRWGISESTLIIMNADSESCERSAAMIAGWVY